MKRYPMTNRVRMMTNSRKREFNFSVRPDTAVHNTASYWDGGSKDSYVIHNIQTHQLSHPTTGTFPTFKSETVLQPMEVLVQCGTFMGKPATPHIFCRESDRATVMEYLEIKQEG